MTLTAQQIDERYTGIGGSDAAAALGLSPYKSALELFLDKRERREPTAAQLALFRWGHLLEPVIRQEYANATGRVVRVPTETLRHPRHNFVLANLDGATDDKRVFEAKTARTAEGWGEPGTDEVPHHYLIQVQHYLAVTAFEVADVAVLIGGNDFRLYEVPADTHLQEMIIDGEAEFWQRTQAGNAPEPDWERSDAAEILRRLYPGTDGSTVIANAEDINCRNAFDAATERARSYLSLAESAKAHLLYRMGEASLLTFADDGVQLRRKQVQRKGYVVEASSYVDARFTKIKEAA